MESPSDNVNGMNADVPLTDFGPMEKHPKMLEAKHIIPYPFGHNNNNHESEGPSRNKRAITTRDKLYLAGTIASTLTAGGFSLKVITMLKHIEIVGNSNISSDYKASYQRFIAYAVGFALLTLILFFINFWNCISDICGRPRTGTDESGLEMGRF